MTRAKRLTQIGWLVTRHGASMTALGAMLVGDAIKGQTTAEAKSNAKIAYDALGQIVKGLQEVRLGLSPIANIEDVGPD